MTNDRMHDSVALLNTNAWHVGVCKDGGLNRRFLSLGCTWCRTLYALVTHIGTRVATGDEHVDGGCRYCVRGVRLLAVAECGCTVVRHVVWIDWMSFIQKKCESCLPNSHIGVNAIEHMQSLMVKYPLAETSPQASFGLSSYKN
jgi:hypothetical protein